MRTRLFVYVFALLASHGMKAQTLVEGGQFMDRILPMEGSVVSSDVWGAPGVLPRLVDNGVEDATYSYWGGNIMKDDDGRYHLYVAGWLESSGKGHATWSSGSMVYHAVADNVSGPYTNIATLGKGHNPETYRAKDGTYVIYVINGRYTSSSLDGDWSYGKFVFDRRGRELIAGNDTTVSLSNCTFAVRQDGSLLMLDRGGGVWISSDGLNDPWHHLTDATVYSGNRRYFEDPVVWRDSLQYHMIVNDWNARIAYYSRSIDGLNWVTEAGTAYQPGVARHADGHVEEWYKYERPKVFLDESGRAAYFNLAVIDTIKSEDKGSDNHSSKNIVMPLNRGMLLEVVGDTPIDALTTSIKVRVKAEPGFSPASLDLQSLVFGSHAKVNYGNGFTVTASEYDGDDLILTFSGQSGASGITAAEFAPKLIGKDKSGNMVYGYARLPYYNYRPSILSSLFPDVDEENKVTSVHIDNYGLGVSAEATVSVYDASNTLLATGTLSPLEPYASADVGLTPKSAVKTGTKNLVVVLQENGGTTRRNTFSTADIATNQEMLRQLVDSANVLLANDEYTEGRERLSAAVATATLYLDVFNLTKTAEAIAALKKAIRTFLFANGDVTENYDFYSWAMTTGAAITMSDSYVTVTDGTTTKKVSVADRISDGSSTMAFGGRIAFDYGSSNFNLRNNGTNNASSGLFDFNKDSYFCVLNLNPGDEVTFNITGLPAYFVSTNVYAKGDENATAVTAGSEVASGTVYVVAGEEGQKVRLDLRGVHYTTIKTVTVRTKEKERISAPVCRITGASYGSRTVTIESGIGTAGSEAEATYYTLDGSEPNTNAILYTAPFTVDDTTTVKALSYLPDFTPSEVATMVVPAGTTLQLAVPLVSITALTGDKNSPLVAVATDNSQLPGAPEATLTASFNGTAVELPYQFDEDGILSIVSKCDGYDDAETSIALAGAYEEKMQTDFTAITAENINGILGQSWTVDETATRWAYWSTGATYYVASTTETGNVRLGELLTTDLGKYLLLGYGVGRNVTSGDTRFWITGDYDDDIACYEVNETRDASGVFTKYYQCRQTEPELACVLNTNYTIARVTLLQPVKVVDAITTVEQQEYAATETYYTLQGVQVDHPRKGIYIYKGKKIVVR